MTIMRNPMIYIEIQTLTCASLIYPSKMYTPVNIPYNVLYTALFTFSAFHNSLHINTLQISIDTLFRSSYVSIVRGERKTKLFF